MTDKEGTTAQHNSERRPSLPAHRAFVVQFRAEAELEQGRCVGRVEHVVSGHAAHFHSAEELLAFMAQVLTATRTQGEGG